MGSRHDGPHVGRPEGVLVLASGAAASLAAYRAMLRIGRLPEEERVLR